MEATGWHNAQSLEHLNSCQAAALIRAARDQQTVTRARAAAERFQRSRDDACAGGAPPCVKSPTRGGGGAAQVLVAVKSAPQHASGETQGARADAGESCGPL